MKKKYSVAPKDKKDWITFTKHLVNVYDKDAAFLRQNTTVNKIGRLDLHGLSLNQANKVAKKFIIESFVQGYKKLLIITGKGLRSKAHNNPYLSEQMNVLKHSVPEYINSNPKLLKVIKFINKEEIKSSSKGSFDIFLKKFKE